MPASILIPIDNCMKCPFCKNERTIGAGYAEDYLCSKVLDPNNKPYGFKLIAGYVEWAREGPQDNQIPDWCPFNSDDII